MRFYKVIIYSTLLTFLTACDTANKESEETSIKGQVIDTEIISQAGYSWTDNDTDFLASPVNIGTYNEHKVLVISDAIAAGKALSVKPIGVMKVKSGEEILYYIIAVPAMDKLRNVNITTFSDFITTYSSAKWIIEQYILSRNGLGAVKLISWEDENYVVSKLL